MPRSRSVGNRIKRKKGSKLSNLSTIGNERNEKQRENESELEEIEPGKYEVAKPKKEKPNGNLEPVVIPKHLAPIDYLTQVQLMIIGRIEKLAVSGTKEDGVKLKANLALLNKILPDLTRNEQTVTISPYERIQQAIDKKEEEDNEDV